MRRRPASRSPRGLVRPSPLRRHLPQHGLSRPAAAALLVALGATAGCSSTPDTVERGAPVLPSSAPTVAATSSATSSESPTTSSSSSTTAATSSTSGTTGSAAATGAGGAPGEPISDGLSVIGDIGGGMTPTYAAQVLHEGSSVRWTENERLTVGFVLRSPTVKDLGDCGTEISLVSDDEKYKESDWTGYHCDESDGYYHFDPDRTGGYTLDFSGKAKGMQLHQRIHFTITD